MGSATCFSTRVTVLRTLTVKSIAATVIFNPQNFCPRALLAKEFRMFIVYPAGKILPRQIQNDGGDSDRLNVTQTHRYGKVVDRDRVNSVPSVSVCTNRDIARSVRRNLLTNPRNRNKFRIPIQYAGLLDENFS